MWFDYYCCNDIYYSFSLTEIKEVSGQTSQRLTSNKEKGSPNVRIKQFYVKICIVSINDTHSGGG